MMTMQQSIACPECGTKICFNAAELLHGATFSCDDCGTDIALNTASQDHARETMAAFERAKKTI
ncbi:hypothetical protein HKD42_06560 [Altererythrobacter sp. RZ02]|uniref:Uncharacterized protein n=1 Tax=Pontixanthobacter rizhaonensis TaxID=2730337 RepID=A0A848QM70_9SPHN|nr:hypothetical protein [Pontixanthobacter rizhaonensis]NMW31717.1 hypothetical protein [Pontixanthobacter rizhaonensis]